MSAYYSKNVFNKHSASPLSANSLKTDTACMLFALNFAISQRRFYIYEIADSVILLSEINLDVNFETIIVVKTSPPLIIEKLTIVFC